VPGHAFGIGDEIATTKALFADLGIVPSPEVLPPLIAANENRRQLLRDAYDVCLGATRVR
jgi:hypothetical protein